ncbi:GNAT family N-acetyltransferase [Microbacterium awajiense]|uniref:GNAT family N-acetyltransferase n=1 Tax=Microbacterium awajiense TaxID=415214 RepID=A0ABP7ABU9_9MICO
MTTAPHDLGDQERAAAWLIAPRADGVRQALAERGLDVSVLAPGEDPAAYAGWLQAASRGFLDAERTDEQIAAARERAGHRRMTGVYDRSGPMRDVPVATICSWIAPLSLPGGTDVPSCAISAVTVAPTHRRRGVARTLLEGELREAAAVGVPIASLTVSESTIYGRFGFAPAAPSAAWRLDTTRASWTGPVPPGRLDYVSRAEARELLPRLHARVRRRIAGEMPVPDAVWDSMAGTRPDAKDPGAVRAVRYADQGGDAAGVALYTVKENHDDFARSSASIVYLVATSDDAYAALWRFFVELDLVAEVRAGELAVDEPLLWMISDQRAATITLGDHHYVRVLDVAGVLESRRYAAPGTIAIDLDDRLGLCAGPYLLTVDPNGSARVRAGSAQDEAAVELVLGVEELSAIALGGVSVATLAAAGRVRCSDVAVASRIFGWHVQPRLSFWY